MVQKNAIFFMSCGTCRLTSYALEHMLFLTGLYLAHFNIIDFKVDKGYFRAF